MSSLPRRSKEEKIKLIRQVLRHADRKGKAIEPGYSRLEDDKYIFHARVHTNTHAGGYVYFASIEKKKDDRKCECCDRPFPPELETVFTGRWDTFNSTVSLKTTDDAGWHDRISYVVIP
jgi:hypothetical protein